MGFSPGNMCPRYTYYGHSLCVYFPVYWRCHCGYTKSNGFCCCSDPSIPMKLITVHEFSQFFFTFFSHSLLHDLLLLFVSMLLQYFG